MADKFLNTGGSGQVNLSNGTVKIFASELSAKNLAPSRPVKTNAVKELVSVNLDISDVNNLQSELNEKQELTFIGNDIHTTPEAGKLKIYAKLDGNMYKKNDQGVESGIGGGGSGSGDVVGPISSVDNAVAFFDGTTGKIIKENTDFKFITGATYGDQLKVPDIETDDHFSVNEELQKISNITSATPGKTVFDGEITTTQTVFTNDQELVTKKYVDDSGGGGGGGFDQSLNTTDMVKFHSVQTNSQPYYRTQNGGSAAPPGALPNGIVTLGSQFTPNFPLVITSLRIRQNQWVSTETTKQIAIWDETGVIVVSGTVSRLDTPSNGYYYFPVNGTTLVAGTTYRIGAEYDNRTGQQDYTDATPQPLSSDFSQTSGYVCRSTATGFLYPDINLGPGNGEAGYATFTYTGGNSGSGIQSLTLDGDAIGYVLNGVQIGTIDLQTTQTDSTLGVQCTSGLNDKISFKVNGSEDFVINQDDVSVSKLLQIGGDGGVQIPFRITNPVYNKEFYIERSSGGLGFTWLDQGAVASSLVSSNNTLNLFCPQDINMIYGGRMVGAPYDMVFAASDEVNAIGTVGQKMSLRCPRTFQTREIKVSVNTFGGDLFSLDIKQNGNVVQSVAQGNSLLTTTQNITQFVEDDVISVDVTNVGTSSATGLKIYLIGRTT